MMDFMYLSLISGALGVIVVIFTFWVGMQGDKENSKDFKMTKEEMKKHCILMLIYSNPADPRGWVEKPYGFGWTINFRKKSWVIVFFGLILCTLAPAVMIIIRYVDYVK